MRALKGGAYLSRLLGIWLTRLSSARPNGTDKVVVLVIGPAPGQAGGISSVMSYIQQEINNSKEFDVRFLDTLRAGRWSIPQFSFVALLTVISIIRARRQGRPIAVHLNVSTGGSTYRKWFISRLCALVGAPYVVHLHGSKYRSFFAASSPLVRQMVKSLFQGARRVIVLGNVWQQYVVNELRVDSSSVAIVANGTPEPEQHRAPGSSQAATVRIVFSGRLSHEKGLSDLLQATDLLYDECRNFELVVMGDSRDAELLGVAQSKPYCYVTGWLNHDEVVQHLSSADIFTLPSYDEGLPMAMIEAMSLGLPVVVTDVGAISDVVSDGCEGFVLQPGDVRGLAAALRSLSADPNLRLKMGGEAYVKWGSELRAEQMTRRVERQWKQAVATDNYSLKTRS